MLLEFEQMQKKMMMKAPNGKIEDSRSKMKMLLWGRERLGE